jgi:ankyrin repeat protein
MAKVYTAKEIQKLKDLIPKEDDTNILSDNDVDNVGLGPIGIKYCVRWLDCKPEPIRNLVDAIVQTNIEKINELINSNLNTVTDLINQKDEFGFTPLMAASALDNLEAAKLLISYGARVDERNNENATALIIACQLGGPRVINELIERGANVNAQTIDGITPLILSGIYGTDETVKILINAGADPSLKDKYGNTALMRAELFGNVSAIQVIKRDGGKILNRAHLQNDGKLNS